jgi:cellulose synthase/poly-beta-1,6-N-acetylglucosamine synthase-like glycosyltransferase
MIFGYSIFVLSFNLILYLVLWILYKFNFRSYSTHNDTLPKVSILIAVRNEEHNIPKLLEGLTNQYYPKEKIQILIGNDGSEDQSLDLLMRAANDQIQIVDIRDQVSGLQGKMNVLAQLAKLAKGQLLLYTDADMRLNPKWIEGMVSSVHTNPGLVGGFTSIQPDNYFLALQNVDLHFGQGMLKVLSDLGIGISVLGNNMLVIKSKLDESGGYEGLDFSVVEDVSLLKRLTESGHKAILSYNVSTHISTIGESSWRLLMNQRLRWTDGFKLTPIWLKLITLLKFSFLPALIYLVNQNPIFILGLVLKVVLSLLFITEIERSVKSKNSVFIILLYEIFESILYYSTLICSVLPIKINWKGREY